MSQAERSEEKCTLIHWLRSMCVFLLGLKIPPDGIPLWKVRWHGAVLPIRALSR
jgi:hypothetical protein